MYALFGGGDFLCHPKYSVLEGNAICVVAQLFLPAAEATPGLDGDGGVASMKKGCCEVGVIVNFELDGGALARSISC